VINAERYKQPLQFDKLIAKPYSLPEEGRSQFSPFGGGPRGRKIRWEVKS
jgi:hypothetical protein